MKSFLAILVACQSAFCADYLTGQAARLVIGQPSFTAQAVDSSGTPIATRLGGTAGVAYANNTLFVADSNREGELPVNNRVLIYTPVSSFPTPTSIPTPQQSLHLTCPVCLGTPSTVVGQANFVSDAQALTQNGLRTPSAVASDGTHLVVADTDNNRVLIWNSIPATNSQNADVVIGFSDFTSGLSVRSPTAKTLRGPQGVWLYNGKLFIADTINNRILIYNQIPASNGASADLVLGQPDFTTLVPVPVTQLVVPATQSNLSSPTSVTTDGTRLYVTDLGHNRVLIWNSIPTTNNQPADVVIGQKDFLSDGNNSYPDTAITPDLCASNGTDSSNNKTYPLRCGETLSFPRFALSDGQRLYIADGGNDRVLVYNTIPTSSMPKADTILGEPDEFTDSSSAHADSLAAPSSLAWDGSNLWVADTYNLRVVAYTPQGAELPITSVRNAASLEIFATGTVTFANTPAQNDVVTLTIAGTAYKYTVAKNDTLANVINGLASQIDGTAAGSTRDANVIAVADTAANLLILSSRVGGAGVSIAFSTTISTGATITATTSGTNIVVNLANATQIAPGTLITVQGANLRPDTQTFAADLTQPFLPLTLGGTTLYIDGIPAPLLYVSATQVNAQMPYETQDRGSVSVSVVSNVNGSASATNNIGSVIVPENPGLFTTGGAVDPRPGLVYHYSNNATGIISVDGAILAGDTATVTVDGRNYKYIVQATDTLQDVRDALVYLLASDSEVTATASNTFTRIFLVAKATGTAGNGIPISVTASTGASISLTAFNSTLCCAGTGGAPVTTQNPAIPGEVLYTYATGLGLTYPQTDSRTGKLVSGPLHPPAIPVDSILAGNKTANIVSAALVPGMVGTFQVVFEIDNTLTTDALTQLTIAQQTHVSNIVTFPVTKP